MSDDVHTWHRCSICKREIGCGESYFSCSVSTCNRRRNPLYFCSLGCWEAHLPMMRHRDAWAEQQRAPSREQWEAERAERDAARAREEEAESDAGTPPPGAARAGDERGLGEVEPRTSVRRVITLPEPREGEASRRVAIEAGLRSGTPQGVELRELDDGELPREVLVVVSKLKAYVKARSGMNTSDGVVGVLSDHLRRLCAEAIRNAARDGRRTVMERDFSSLR